jgi:hypothetical protein
MLSHGMSLAIDPHVNSPLVNRSRPNEAPRAPAVPARAATTPAKAKDETTFEAPAVDARVARGEIDKYDLATLACTD